MVVRGEMMEHGPDETGVIDIDLNVQALRTRRKELEILRKAEFSVHSWPQVCPLRKGEVPLHAFQVHEQNPPVGFFRQPPRQGAGNEFIRDMIGKRSESDNSVRPRRREARPARPNTELWNPPAIPLKFPKLGLRAHFRRCPRRRALFQGTRASALRS